ncbi:hypothetical protein K439DRAFT_1630228 [Ramaria rubella]|nr:hypothetical protein K439DRAFT_1630228 [Ramaria rubella]
MASGSTQDSPTTYQSSESDSDVDFITETVEESEEEEVDKSGLPCQTLRCHCR